VLRGELTRRLGVRWTPVRDGIAQVAGVPDVVVREFSRRRAQIEAELADRDTRGPRAAEAAALATRRRKDPAIASTAALAVDWRSRAADLGFSNRSLRRLLGRQLATDIDADLRRQIAAALAAPDGLTLKKSSFTRLDAVLAVAERLPAGTSVTAAELEAIADAFLVSGRAVELLADAEPETFRRRAGGRRVPVGHAQRRFASVDLVDVERRLIAHALAAQNARVGIAEAGDVESALRARPTLTAEQATMVSDLCRRGSGIAVVVGKAGAGKTFALAAARDAWEASGYPVRGAAVARRAARELETGAGIPSTSVAAILSRRRLPARVVVVVDEAAMVGTRQLADLMSRVDHAGGKLVLVGDSHQLAELEAGGAFRALVQRGLAVELTGNRRQDAAWEREALDELRAGDPAVAVARYAERGRIVVTADAMAARERLVADWSAQRDPDGVAMIARRRADVRGPQRSRASRHARRRRSRGRGAVAPRWAVRRRRSRRGQAERAGGRREQRRSRHDHGGRRRRRRASTRRGG
jgi:hypothetical protein